MIVISGRLQVAGDARRAQLGPLRASARRAASAAALQLGRIGAGEQHRDVAAADAGSGCGRRPARPGSPASCGATWRWNSVLVRSRPSPGPSATRRWWRCRPGPIRRPRRRRAARASRRRRGRRPRGSARASTPGGISTETCTVSVVRVRLEGESAAWRRRRSGATKQATPMSTVFQRLRSVQRSSAHIAVHQPAFAMLGLALRLEEIGRDHRRDHAARRRG